MAFDKDAAYVQAAKEIAAVVEGEPNRVARMATVSSILSQAFDSYFWAGFYVVDADRPGELVVGPYQGTLGCMRIPIGKGVCGTAAASRKTMIVEDVHAFPGHIACDVRSNSEIVVPVLDRDDRLIGVFDVDSTAHGAFDQTDARHLESIMKATFGC